MVADIVKVLYIGGYGRSGSTLLVQLLGQMEGLHSVGEMWNIWQQCFVENQLCGCGKPFRECSFWCAVVEEAYGGFDRLDLAEINRLAHLMRSPQYLLPIVYPSLRTSVQRETIKNYQRYLTRLYSAIKSVSGNQMIVDSSKGPRYAMLLNEIPEIDLRVVHLVRDSRGVAYSWQKKRVKPEVYWKTEYMDRVDPFTAAILWNFTNLFMQSLDTGRHAARKGGYLFVRYEDLIDAPRFWLAKILQLAGGNPDQINAQVNAVDGSGMVKMSADHSAGGNPSRYHQGAVTLRPDVEWLEKMPQLQQVLVTLMTAPLLHRYGYSTSLQAASQRRSTAENYSPLAEKKRSLS
jgi:hypothetical protein